MWRRPMKNCRIDAEETKRKFVREKGWYVPALHERYIEMRRGDGGEQARGKSDS